MVSSGSGQLSAILTLTFSKYAPPPPGLPRWSEGLTSYHGGPNTPFSLLQLLRRLWRRRSWKERGERVALGPLW